MVRYVSELKGGNSVIGWNTMQEGNERKFERTAVGEGMEYLSRTVDTVGGGNKVGPMSRGLIGRGGSGVARSSERIKSGSLDSDALFSMRGTKTSAVSLTRT